MLLNLVLLSVLNVSSVAFYRFFNVSFLLILQNKGLIDQSSAG